MTDTAGQFNLPSRGRSSVALVLVLFFALPVQAQQRLPFKPSAAEVSVLPEYCQARLSGNADLQRSWAQTMGKENFMHLHHFCYGLNYMNRVKLIVGPNKHKRHYLQTALAQFNYVIRNWPEEFPLTAEAKSHKNQIEIQMKLQGM